MNDPKDEKVTNKDESVTNKDGDNDLEKGISQNRQNGEKQKQVPTVTPDNDNGDPGPTDGECTVEKGLDTAK